MGGSEALRWGMWGMQPSPGDLCALGLHLTVEEKEKEEEEKEEERRREGEKERRRGRMNHNSTWKKMEVERIKTEQL